MLETEEYGISSFVIRAPRPFHPARFQALLEEGLEGVLRAKGFLWLASRHTVAGILSWAGSSVSIEPAALWYANLAKELADRPGSSERDPLCRGH